MKKAWSEATSYKCISGSWDSICALYKRTILTLTTDIHTFRVVINKFLNRNISVIIFRLNTSVTLSECLNIIYFFHHWHKLSDPQTQIIERKPLKSFKEVTDLWIPPGSVTQYLRYLNCSHKLLQKSLKPSAWWQRSSPGPVLEGLDRKGWWIRGEAIAERGSSSRKREKG